MSGASYPMLVVSLGTDHHKFDRLVDWIDDWLAARDDPPSCLIQHGASREPRFAAGIPRMPREDLLDLYARATVVVVQGGPGSILDAREVGQMPIAVPRRPELHEVVDGHQIAFTATMAHHGEAIAAESAAALAMALDYGFGHPELMRTAPRRSGAAVAAQKLQDAVAGLDTAGHGHMALRRIRQVLIHH
ncbi:MAG: hypothetical protein ACHP7K_00910 [Actinomycetales bacterium]